MIPAEWLHPQGLDRSGSTSMTSDYLTIPPWVERQGQQSGGLGAGKPRLLGRRTVRGGERALSYGIEVIGKG